MVLITKNSRCYKYIICYVFATIRSLARFYLLSIAYKFTYVSSTSQPFFVPVPLNKN